MDDQRRPYHIFVRLAGSAFYHQSDLVRLRGSLPACTRAVVADGAVVVLATLSRKTSDELIRDCKESLGSGRYVAITTVQLGAHSASTDGLLDPFHDWMNVNVRHGARREGDEAEDMLKAKWGERGRENSEHRGIADAIRKVFPGTTWPRQKRG